VTSSSLLYFRRTLLRIPKPKPNKTKTKPMRKHKVVPTKTQNKWLSVNEQVRLALNKDAVKATSVTQHKTVSEKFLTNIERLKSGEFEAKRKQALSEYWQAKREKKAKSKAMREYHKRYLEENQLGAFSTHIPKELLTAFRNHCDSNGITYGEAVVLAFVSYLKKQ
jgi:hypothetical protein